MIRADYLFEDVKGILMALFEAKQVAAPWNSWRIIGEYPNSLEFRQFANKKPILFLEDFEAVDKIITQGQTLGISGGKQHYGYQQILQAPFGIWLHKKHGGPKEMRIIKSHILNLFDPPEPKLPATTFDITIGSDSYSGTTVYEQGLYDIEISGGREIATEDQDEFRQEMILTVSAIVGESETIS